MEAMFQKLDSMVFRLYGFDTGKTPMATFIVEKVEEQTKDGVPVGIIHWKQVTPCTTSANLSHGSLQVGSSQARIELGETSAFRLDKMEVVAGDIIKVTPIVAAKKTESNFSRMIGRVIDTRASGTAMVIRKNAPLICERCGAGDYHHVTPKPDNCPEYAHAIICGNCSKMQFVRN